ncbi:MAG: hypothetical protein OSB69_20190 [Alphaproteobacteria bacterium]|nr:hypothetical protein [Alphaproteobacteria bacterium]
MNHKLIEVLMWCVAARFHMEGVWGEDRLTQVSKPDLIKWGRAVEPSQSQAVA